MKHGWGILQFVFILKGRFSFVSGKRNKSSAQGIQGTHDIYSIKRGTSLLYVHVRSVVVGFVKKPVFRLH